MKIFVFILFLTLVASCDFKTLEKKINNQSIEINYIYELSNNIDNSKDTINFRVIEKYSILKSSFSVLDRKNRNFNIQYPEYYKNLESIVDNYFQYKYYVNMSEANVFDLTYHSKQYKDLSLPINQNAVMDKVLKVKEQEFYYLKGTETINNETLNAKYQFNRVDGFTNIELTSNNKKYSIKLIDKIENSIP